MSTLDTVSGLGRRRRSLVLLAGLTVALAAAGCTGSGSAPTSATTPPVASSVVSPAAASTPQASQARSTGSARSSAGLTSTASSSRTPSSRTSPRTSSSTGGTPTTTRQDPPGMQTGPGVTGHSITLAVLDDPELDQGFAAGVALWQSGVNAAGGVCGRTIVLARSGHDGVPADLAAAYLAIGRGVLGLITLAPAKTASTLAGLAGPDGVPALTPIGTSTQLGVVGPVVIGPTDDVTAINALDYLVGNGLVANGAVGVMTDGSAAATDALAGLSWQAAREHVTLDVRDADAKPAAWNNTAVISLQDPAGTAALLAATPPWITVLTPVTGYAAGTITAARAARLLVIGPTPAFGSDNPPTAAIASLYTKSGGRDAGPLLLAGYATGSTWGRLLTAACTADNLTRSGIDAALTTVGPAPVDSVMGPVDPGLPVTKHRPATRLTAISRADPGVAGGLKGLTWLVAAADVGDYRPAS